MRAPFVWTFFALALAAGCGGGGAGDPLPPPAADGGGGAAACTSGNDCDGACVDLESDPKNCGSCGRTCVVLHGEAACDAGECVLDGCALGYADCDADSANGCELAIDCDDGGSCATSCGTGTLDCADPCAPVCHTPAESCNAIDDDCNDACDDGAIEGCRVAVHRAYNATNGHLLTTDLAQAQSWGLEAESFFYLYSDAAADLRPFFHCAKANGNPFYTDSTDCETTGGPLATVGFIAPLPAVGESATCGALPLYRLHHATKNWHFYTHSLAERDAALASGWSDQGLAGHVWLAP